MGCICSKGASTSEYVQNHNGREKETRSSKRFVASSKKDGTVVENDGSVNDVTTRLISGALLEDNVVSTPVGWEDEQKHGVTSEQPASSQIQRHSTRDNGGNGEAEVAQTKSSRIVSIPNGAQVAHIAAGWPSWLTAVAGEAISGWVPRRADTFEKLEKIGQGTYSSVYRARDL